MRRLVQVDRTSSGMTLVELLVTTTILAIVSLIVTGIFISTSRLHTKTARRAEVQMNSLQGLSLMTTELRQAGADPATPPMGLTGLVSAQGDLIRVRSDLNGDGVLQTAEPSEDVTFSFDSTARAILRNPGSGTAVLVPNVKAMSLSYFNELNQPITPLPLSTANAALVRAVGVTITAEDRDSRAITFTTRVAFRNF